MMSKKNILKSVIILLFIFALGGLLAIEYYCLFYFDVDNLKSKNEFGWYFVAFITVIGLSFLFFVSTIIYYVVQIDENKNKSYLSFLPFEERKKRLLILSKVFGIISAIGAVGFPICSTATYYSTNAEEISQKQVSQERKGSKEVFYGYPIFDNRKCIPTEEFTGIKEAKRTYLNNETQRAASFINEKNYFYGIYYFLIVVFGGFSLVKACLDFKIERMEPPTSNI